AGGARAGEHQGVDRLVEQGGADVAAALDQIDHAGGQVGRLERLDDQLAGQGGLFGRLEHQGVAGEQGRDDVAVGQVAGEVERAEHRGDAGGAVAQHGAAEGGV